MRLYHATDDVGKAGIEAQGFAVSHLPDSVGCSWFYSSTEQPQLASRGGWWVIVKLPGRIAAQYRYEHDPNMYCVPWSVINAYRPFEYESQ